MKKKAGFRAVGLLATLALFVGMSLAAAVDYYLKIEGIPGESTVRGFENQIEVDAWSWGETQTGTMPGREGTILANPARPQPFIIVKPLDKASPKLAGAMASKQHFPSVTLTLCRAGGDKQPYMRYQLQDCYISSMKKLPPTVGGVPMEEVSFNYGKVEWKRLEGGARPAVPKARNPME